MNAKKNLQIILMLFFFFISCPKVSFAYGDAAIILPALSMAKSYLMDKISGGTDDVMNKISDMQQSISVTVANSTNNLKNILVDQNSKIAEGNIQMQADIAQKEAENRAEEKYLRMPPGVCETMAASAMASGGRELTRIKAASFGRDLATRNALMPNKLTATMQAYNDHKNKYCGKADEMLQRCNASTTMPDADTSVATLLDGAGPVGSGPSTAFTKDQIDAAQAYIKNITNSTPLPNLTPDLEKTGPGQDYVAAKLADQAKLDLAARPAVEALARNSPMTTADGQKFGAHIKSIWENMEKNGTVIPDQFRKALAANNDEASYDFFLKTEVDRRFSNPQWYIEIYGAEPAAIAREQAFMTALQLHLMNEQSKQLQTIGLLLGGIYAEQIRNPQAMQILHDKFQAAAGTGTNIGR